MLIPQAVIDSNSYQATRQSHWFTTASQEISDTLSCEVNKFPCFFSRNAFARKNICFLPIEKQKGKSYKLNQLSRGLDDYLNRVRDWDGQVNTVEPLLVVFEPNFDHYYDAKGFVAMAHTALQHLIDADVTEWPKHIPQNPQNQFWSFCYGGVPLFVNISHPAHFLRKSRTLCRALTLVINPRERFDQVASVFDKGGLSARERIRANIDKYDLIEHSPLLGHYQLGESEWNQYALPDTNHASAYECPLHQKRQKEIS